MQRLLIIKEEFYNLIEAFNGLKLFITIDSNTPVLYVGKAFSTSF